MVRRDHPRACGEQPKVLASRTIASGSSPRVRGTDSDLRTSITADGIIPARAGNSWISSGLSMTCWDHPRACGEQCLPALHAASDMGSSPRVRGTAIAYGVTIDQLGIIPARAGNSCCRAPRWLTRRDHPRACGEQAMSSRIVSCMSGSSPRVRGTAHAPARARARAGIIPARAGNRACLSSRGRSRRDHPRACGEQAQAKGETPLDRGSSPRVRGTELEVAATNRACGIIPARAGNSQWVPEMVTLKRDHPRACGEQ